MSDDVTDAPTDPSPYDHVAGDGDVLPAGTYRVVGVGGDDVTLLRVTDADGRRVNSGELATVRRSAYESLAAADNPDETGPLTTWGLLAFGVLVYAAGSYPPVVAATGLSETAITTAGVAVAVVGFVRVMRNRR